MSKTNLHSFLKNIADAIRSKSGSTDPINPQDFANKIKTLQGGSAETPRSYYKIRQEFLEENNATVGQTLRGLSEMLSSLDNVYFILNHSDVYNFEIDHIWCYIDEEFAAKQFTGYFSTLNSKNYPLIHYKDYDFESGGVVNGIGLQERYYCIIKQENPDISYEDFTEMWNEEMGKMFEEITKEEYESQLTIK